MYNLLNLGNTLYVEITHPVFLLCRLVLGALASFLAIMLWARTRDIAWLFVILAVIISYAEIVNSVLTVYDLGIKNVLPESYVFVVTILLSGLPVLFFIAAFLVMVVRKYRR